MPLEVSRMGRIKIQPTSNPCRVRKNILHCGEKVVTERENPDSRDDAESAVSQPDDAQNVHVMAEDLCGVRRGDGWRSRGSGHRVAAGFAEARAFVERSSAVLAEH